MITHKAARELIDKMKNKNKKYYDKTAHPLKINIGDTVYLRQEPYDKLSTLNNNNNGALNEIKNNT